MNCPKCGADNADSALFCGSCGQPLKVNEAEEQAAQTGSFDNESDTLEEEQKRLDKKRSKKSGKLFKRVTIGVLAVVVVGLGTVIGIGLYQQHVRDSMTYADKVKATDIYKQYAEAYKGDFSDPVGTYLSSLQDNGNALTVLDEKAAQYNLDSNETSVDADAFGFSVLTDESKTGFGKEDAEALFNKYTCPMLTNYLNALAKNPKHRDIVNHEFKDSCGGYSFAVNGDTTKVNNSDVKKYADTLVDVLTSVVDKYGSNSDFSIIKINPDKWNDENCTECADSLSGKNLDGDATHQDDFLQLLINVKTYTDDGKCKETIEKIENFNMFFTQDPSSKWWGMGIYDTNGEKDTTIDKGTTRIQ